MGFLIRSAFWLSAVLLVLPLGGGDEEAAVGPVQTLLAARDAVSDLAGICERKPTVCETGRSAMQTIAVRAGEGARLAYEMLDDGEAGALGGPDVATTGSIAAQAGAKRKVSTAATAEALASATAQ